MSLPKDIHGLLIDLDGVLFAGETPVAGARDVISRLGAEEFPGRYPANAATWTAFAVIQELRRLAFCCRQEYVSGKNAKVIGKSSRNFFEPALKSPQLPASEVAMIGDDIETDIGGGKASGMYGVLAKPGKYREGCENYAEFAPDCQIDSFGGLFECLDMQSGHEEKGRNLLEQANG